MKVLGTLLQTPDEIKRYTADYSAWLDDAETVSSVGFEIVPVTTPALEVSDEDVQDTSISFYLSGGVHGETYKLVVQIETSEGQIKQDLFVVSIRDFTP